MEADGEHKVDEFSIQYLFADLEDPRQANKVKHRLDDIILLAILYPAPEVAIDGLPGRKIKWQQPPGTTGA